MQEMVNIMLAHTDTYTDTENKEVKRMKISDKEICAIICAAGYKVNISYIERLRRAYDISARNKNKYFDDDLTRIHEIIKEYASGDGSVAAPWKMSVSDAAMAEVLKAYNFRDINIHTKYVERVRHSLGIKAFQERGQIGQANRVKLLRGNVDILAILHEQAVLQLSIRHSSGNSDMYGTAGVDAYTPGIGAHTLGYEEALERKEKHIRRLQSKEKERRIGEKLKFAKALEILSGPDIEEVDYSSISGNGGYSRGKGGGRKSLRNSQIYQSI
jgi:hypothetical protein